MLKKKVCPIFSKDFNTLWNEIWGNSKIYNEKNFLLWKKKWEDRIKLNNNSLEKSLKIMRKVNPLVIPRNHLVEEALSYATKMNDLKIIQSQVLKA